MVTRHRTLLVATHNPGKLREIRTILSDVAVELKILSDYPNVPEATEDQETFIGNARKKALYYAAATGMLTLADDSGLVVDCLGGAPGVHSARYAGPQKDTGANNRKLVADLKGVELADRKARFVCAVVVAEPNQILAEATGQVEGLIVDEPRGPNGFGYDPHFFIPSLSKTVAELLDTHKNKISHRGRALQLIKPSIVSLLKPIG